MMNQADTFANTGGPMLKKLSTTKEFMERGLEIYRKLKCSCDDYSKSGWCDCTPKKSVDNLAGGRNPNFCESHSEIIVSMPDEMMEI